MGNLVDKVKKGALILGAAAAIGLASCDLCGVDPIPEDTTKPVISLMGDNPYNTVVGDPFIEQGYSASDDTDGDVTSYVSRNSNDDVSNSGNYFVKYNVSDEAGNQADEKTRAINRTVETSELEAMLNTETIMDKAGGGKMTVLEAARSLGFDLYRGTNDNVADNIEGSYLASGSGTLKLSDGTSLPVVYSNEDVVFSNQNDFSIDKFSTSNYDAVITGYDVDKVGVIYFQDDNNDGTPERVSLSNIEILSNGDLDVDRIDFFVNEYGLSADWVRYSESYVK